MDEILIEEKKYVSSKRAAKITGYAKDYIGQLCREGRVPARLIGRSWYVLETAIQDHRFGTADIHHPEGTVQATAPVFDTLPSTWESPRYEASSGEFLPSINRLQHPADAGVVSVVEDTEDIKTSRHLQDSWKEWFDRMADEKADIPDVEKTKIEDNTEEKPVDVPVHVVYRQPPEELLPRSMKTEEQEQPVFQSKKVWNKVSIMTIQVCSVLLAVIIASLAIIGSGYLDKYIISNSQARIISGIGLYNK